MKKLLSMVYFLLLINICTISLNAKIFIESKVNDKIITNYDIEIEAAYLTILNSNLKQITNEQLKELAKQSLIREIIKENEILKYSSINTDSVQINNRLSNLILKLNFKDEQEFENTLNELNSYSLYEVKKKIGIEFYWSDLIYNKYRNQIKIDEKKLIQKIEKMEQSEQNSYKFSEILFDLKKDENLNNKIKQINTSIKEIGFNNTANIFSISDNAKMGGKLDWINENSLSKKILENIKNLKTGQISKVINIGNNFLILKVDEIKKIKKKINKDKLLKKITNNEVNNQLNKFSIIYFNKVQINYTINDN